MAKRSNYDIPVTLLRGGVLPPEKMTLAEAVCEVMESPIRDSLVDVRIICEEMLIEGIETIAAIYALPGFPKRADDGAAGD